MDSLYVLVPIAMVFTGLAIVAYMWAVDSGQYRDLEREGQRILFDDLDLKSAEEPISGHDRGSRRRLSGK